MVGSPDALSPSRAIGPHRGHASARRAEEEEARKRQMAQDIDSAMSMSRARSSSIVPAETSPALRPSNQRYHSSSPIQEDDLGMSRYEQDAIHAAQYGDLHDDLSEIEHPAYRPEEGHENLMDEPNIAHSHHGESLGSGSFEAHARLLRRHSEEGRRHGHGHGHAEDRQRHEVERRLGLTGGVHAQNNNFDFGEMEQFAAVERDKLGLNTGYNASPPAIPISPADGAPERISAEAHIGSWDTDNMPRTTTFSAFGDDDTAHVTSPRGEGQTFARRRQRKLSQSNPVQRRGGKLALFEGFGNAPGGAEGEDGVVVKAPRLPKNALPIGPTGGGIMPYSDNAPGHDRPYRFSFYSNALPVTIHARTLAELPGEGQSFEDLFKGKNSSAAQQNGESVTLGGTETPKDDGIKASMLARAAGAATRAGVAVPPSMQSTPGQAPPGMADISPSPADEDGEAFTWWMDVLSPTDEEMRMLSKVFGIHPLTTEDILLEETREKIELFRNYYLVCFRSFDQDPYSQTYLEPLNMYIIVFREGTLSFHFRGTPHPQNVRRRIKHLKDYISVTSDWISYALIDDITDAFGPLIQSIEYEVDSIDELVLILKDSEQSDMLRRIGTCRKKVMGLLRLMGNKADVVKGLAKRCNEQWLVAPKSDIGLYLSDIQDHLITMTQNLNHYEKILSRSHSNYLAQISIEMTDANNQINDVLSKLTALGTVLIPMNLVTGLWGMNVHVPGQDIEEGYAWFGGILGCLMAFAVLGAFATYKCFVVR